MRSAFCATGRFIKSNFFTLLTALMFYWFVLIVLWALTFGGFEPLDNVGFIISCTLKGGPPQTIFTVLNYPWSDIPFPLVLGGIYYMFIAVMIKRIVKNNFYLEEYERKKCFPGKISNAYSIQKYCFLGGLIQLLISLFVPISNLFFFINSFVIVQLRCKIWEPYPCNDDIYWVVPLYVFTAYSQGMLYGWIYFNYIKQLNPKVLQRNILYTWIFQSFVR